MALETGTTYATTRELYLTALPARALAPSPMPCELVDPSANRIVLRSHGLVADEQVTVKASTLPGGLSATVVYFVRVVSQDLLELAASAGGAAVDITSVGAGPLYLIPQSTPEQVEMVLQQVSREVDWSLRGHATPLATWSPLVPSIVARIAAHRLAVARGLLRPEYKDAMEPLRYEAERAHRLLDECARGVPMDALTEDATPSVADLGAVGFTDDAESPGAGALS